VKGILLAVFVVLASVAAPSPARAEGPTPEQLDAAKKAYGEGKALHEQGKLVEAIEKFKESYRLSKNPVLLYNIGLTLDESGQKETAVLFYRKFLMDAPQTAAQRQTALERVKVLEKEKLDADLAGPTTTPPPPAKEKDKDKETVVATAPEPKPEPVKPPKTVRIKPAGTYGASDFQHQVLDTAPPSKPLDVTAFVPEDSGFVVTLYYRGKGESQFTAKQMKWRNKELVARIPAAKMTGSAIQYYIRVKDAADKTISESGKATDPNLISIEAGSATHYYTDMTDDSAGMVEPKHHDEDDPLGHKSTAQATTTEPDGSGSGEQVDNPTVSGQGFLDVGSKKFTYTKWGTTGGAGLFLLGGIIFYTQASAQASNLEKDSKSCGTPPCRPFDSYDQSVQSAGHEFNTLSNVGIAFGVVAAGVAGYYWYRELTTKKPHHDDQPAAAPSSDTSWIVVPSAGNGFAGAAAAVRF
jgi:tetratricopeptide (TPR) repeat protein